MEIHNKISEKIEKLAAAMYLVTEHLSDRESIKYDLRGHAVTAVSLVGTYTKVSPFDRDTLFSDIEMTVSHILSLVRVLLTVKIIREENLQILLNEYQKFQDTLKNYHLQYGLNETTANLGSIIGAPLSIDSIGSQETAFREQTKSSTFLERKDHTTQVKVPLFHQKKETVSHTNFTDKKDNRKKQILDIIKDKKEVTIKDIATIIKDCSEKTIQRELTALVDEAVVVRIGDKRWSKYLLK